ncbi:SH3 domain-containing protein [Natranaerovirga pectinivora]|uniref:SH3 domain-containing protein n=1 Tax=Natranaerovirga pectinivora TaxID=682400 RepID=A0A4R3MIV1_9FIRM|nr:C40 family peptidase [Natranaerovirga pectinivora]TCT13810.1 SH3 domain-containing protein [Natranaerovirga pectinivora]
MKKHLRKVTFGLIGSLLLTSNIYGAEKGVVNTNILNVRSGPGTHFSVTSQLRRGQEVEVIDSSNEWLKVNLNNQEVFLHSDFVSIIEVPVQEESIVQLQRQAIVDTDILNVRSTPSVNGTRITQLRRGEKLGVVSQSGEWYLVTGPNNIEGFVHGDFIRFAEDKTVLSEQNQVKELIAVVDVNVLNVRQEPNTNSSIIGKTYRFNQLKVVRVLEEWVEIVQTDGRTGYVSKDFTTIREIESFENVDRIRQEVVDYARQFLGNPYSWGGNSLTDGIDCSGFTQQILGRFGFNISRTSRTQINDGVRINRNELLPGDLVFYGNNNSISHVALFIGNGQIIHASNRRTGIIISNIDYGTPYIGAARIIN